MDERDRKLKTAWKAAQELKVCLSVAWNGNIVGWIKDPDFDFPHYSGRWIGADNLVSRVFLAELRRAVEAEEGVEVTLEDTTRGIVYVHPDDEKGKIDVRIRGSDR